MKPKTRLYGDCIENPTKVTKRSERTCCEGKGDWQRPVFDKGTYEKVFDSISPPKEVVARKTKSVLIGDKLVEVYHREY